MEQTTLLPRIATGFLLGKIRFNPDQGEPSYLHTLRVIMSQCKRALGGGENFSSLTEEMRPAMHCLADLVFDACAGTSQRAITIEKLKKLPVPQRLMVENLAASLTGRLSRHDRWMDELWEIKHYIARASELSASGLTAEEIREGFDPLIHEVVDQLYDQREALAV